MRFARFGQHGDALGDLSGVLSATRERGVDGTDELTITCTGEVAKYDRLVWRDPMGRWVESMVYEVSEQRGDSAPVATAYAGPGWRELSRTVIVEREGRGYTAQQALAKVLDGTRWEAGVCSDAGTRDVSWYHTDALTALRQVAEDYGLEIEATYEVDGSGVTSRTIALVSTVGKDSGRRFEYRKDLQSVTRTVDAQDVVTRLYAYGKGLPATGEDGQPTGGYTRKLDLTSVTEGGVEFVEDAEATAQFGVPGPDGSMLPAEGVMDYPDCGDATELLALAEASLAEMSKPRVSYEADVTSLARGGMDATGVDVGDRVQIVDHAFATPLRLQGRVLRVSEDLLGPSSNDRITLGSVTETLTQSISSTASTVGQLAGDSGAWGAASSLDADWLDGVISGLNAQMNSTGGYAYIEPGAGIVVYDRPRDQSPTMAVQIGGGGIRIADSKTSGGEWDWRTFGTGAGFTADEINAGTLSASLIKAGILQDATGTNYWNMETGDFRLTGVKYWLASCPTAADVTAKVATVAQQGFALTQGVMVLVEWANGNSAESPTLDVGGTGAYPVKIYGGDLAGGTVYDWAGGSTGLLYFDGGAWNICDNASLFRNNQAVREVRDLDSSLDSQGVFDRLTNDGAIQGLFMQDGNLYANATYVKTGILSDGVGKNFWNMDTGEFSLSAGTKVGGQTVDQIAGDKADAARIPFVACSTAAATAAKTVTVEGFQLVAGAAIMVRFTDGHRASAMTMDVSGTGAKAVYASGNNPPALNRQSTVLMTYSGSTWTMADSGALYNASSLDRSLDQQGVFDRLTNGGQDQGIYLQDGRVYINGEYIKAGTVVADKLGSGVDDYARVGDFTVRLNGTNVVRSGIVYYKDGHPRFLLTLEGNYGNPALVIMAFTSDTDAEIVYMSYNGAVSMSSIDGQYSMFVNSRGLVIQQGTTQKVVATF